MIHLLLLLIAFTLQPDPHLHASLTSPSSSVVTWTADRRLCLSYNGAVAECYPAGSWRVTFGAGGALDGRLRVRAGGVYVLSDPVTGASWTARVGWWRYLAVWWA